MRNNLGYAVLGVALVVLYHILPPTADEALGGSWWWWLLVTALAVLIIWRDLQSSRKPQENQPPEPQC